MPRVRDLRRDLGGAQLGHVPGAEAYEVVALAPWVVLIRTADAVAKLHAAGYRHGDLCLWNVLWSEEEEAVRLIDFTVGRKCVESECDDDLIIIEDDPYFYLSYAAEKTPSMLSLDTDGRVLRTDSFSKIFSAGLRLGFVTGPAPLIQRLTWHMQATTIHASGLAQAVALRLLNHWTGEESRASGKTPAGAGGGGGGGGGGGV